MNTLSSTSMPEVYRAWWGESVEQLAVARELLTLERHSSTVFHAWMALELAIKAVRLAPARIGDLDFLTYKLSTYTVGDLGGLEHETGHRALLALMEHPGIPATRPLRRCENLARSKMSWV